MKTLYIYLLASFLFAGIACEGEISDLKSVSNWGEPSCGAILALGISNNIIKPGEKSFVYITIKNISANTISVPASITNTFSITNSLGKIYKIGQIFSDVDEASMHYKAIQMRTGEIQQWKLKVKFGADIEPGDYIFDKITHYIHPDSRSKDTCALVSNSLKIKVVP